MAYAFPRQAVLKDGRKFEIVNKGPLWEGFVWLGDVFLVDVDEERGTAEMLRPGDAVRVSKTVSAP